MAINLMMEHQAPLSMGRQFMATILHEFGFHDHWHTELEIHFCLEGEYGVIINGVERVVRAGQVVVIGSMEVHSTVSLGCPARAILLVAGHSFYGEGFNELAQRSLRHNVFAINDAAVMPASASGELRAVFDGLQAILSRPDPEIADEWLIKSGLLQIGALIERHMQYSLISLQIYATRLKMLERINKAFSYVAERYRSDITLDEIADHLCYEKKSFCRSFKKAVGMTFHDYLNAYRVEEAKKLLVDITLPIAAVGDLVGFPLSKTFSEVFKKYTDLTPTQFQTRLVSAGHAGRVRLSQASGGATV